MSKTKRLERAYAYDALCHLRIKQLVFRDLIAYMFEARSSVQMYFVTGYGSFAPPSPQEAIKMVMQPLTRMERGFILRDLQAYQRLVDQLCENVYRADAEFEYSWNGKITITPLNQSAEYVLDLLKDAELTHELRT